MTLAECAVICLETAPQRGETGTDLWDVHPKTAFWAHIQNVELQAIDVDGSEDNHSAVRKGDAQEI